MDFYLYHYLLSYIIVGSGLAILSLFVYFKGNNKPVFNTFALMNLAIAWWCLLSIPAILSRDLNVAVHWCRTFIIGAIFIAPLFLHFTYLLLGQLKKKRYKVLLKIAYLFSFIFFIFNFTPFFIVAAEQKQTLSAYTKPGPIFHLHVVHFFIIMFYGELLFFKKFLQERRSIEARKYLYFFITSFLGTVGGGANYLITYNCEYPIINPFGTYLVLIYALTVTYIIFKYRFLDMEVIIRKTLVYSILISIITILYFVIIYASERLFSRIIGYKSIPLAIIIVALFSAIFIPLKNKIQRSIDKYFFKGTIDQIEKEKEMLGTELERSERLKAVSTLAAGMAHEIKNPLTSIKTFVEHVYEKENDAKFKAKFMAIVPREIDKIASLIDQLLNYSKVERINMRTHNIHNLLDYVSDLYSNVLLNKHITLRKRYGAQLPDITCDENQLKQAFINIILNSIEAMSNGGEIDVQTQNVGSAIEISIKDNGAGIPKDKIAHLFEPFYTTKDKGTGLGLFIVHQIIGNNKGSIVIHSEANDGTTVNIKFKIC